MASRSLLDILQSLIERTYRMETGVRDLHRFVVGDRGLRALYSGRAVVAEVGAASYPEAKVLVREAAGEVFVNLYLPDDLVAALERDNPLRGVDARNLDAFAVFVEEIDHLLTIAERARERRPVSLFELELHAGVTKYLACRHFLEKSLARPLLGGELAWLRWSLFEKQAPAVSASPEVRRRYRDADRLAGRYSSYLGALPGRERVSEARAFHRRPLGDSLRRIAALPA